MNADNPRRPAANDDPATATNPKKTFDMYHVFRRRDVALLVGFVLILLLIVFFLSFAGGSPGA